MFNADLHPTQTPDYLEAITSALVAEGYTAERARAMAPIFFPNPKTTPEQQVADVVRMKRAVAAAGLEDL